ncbi:VOC family protein [Pseudolysinimonas sp.]|uniref:VOC family protein n=1 Tax=Pseudolysinimonas sp. TaxID=2680009 RepID=UPI00286C8657|nr:VOC family protein [Pseudolysinimonas sp.]
MTENPVAQLRLVLETADLDAALTFYRDALGLRELESYDGPAGARVVILEVPTATLELANPAQVAYIDAVEVGRPVAHPYPLTVRVAFEVPDAVAATARLAARGAEVVAAPVETPWRSLNARFEAPGGMQISVFEELDTP